MTVWIVDYDLPANSSRRSFYRHVKAWLRGHNMENDKTFSTYSVVITENREFAEFVYSEASQLGRANLYEARLMKSSLPEDLPEEAVGLVTRETEMLKEITKPENPLSRGKVKAKENRKS